MRNLTEKELLEVNDFKVEKGCQNNRMKEVTLYSSEISLIDCLQENGDKNGVLFRLHISATFNTKMGFYFGVSYSDSPEKSAGDVILENGKYNIYLNLTEYHKRYFISDISRKIANQEEGFVLINSIELDRKISSIIEVLKADCQENIC